MASWPERYSDNMTFDLRVRVARSRSVSTVAGWFGYVRLTKMDSSAGKIQFTDPRWYHVGRQKVKAIKQIRNEDPS